VKAIRFHRYGAAEVLRWEETRAPRPGPGQVRVAVHAAALNPKDILTRKGKMRFVSPGLPHLSGQDLAGVVEAVGPGVRAKRVGERVFGMIGGLGAGACAELAVLKASECALMPRRASMTEAASVPLAGLTALQALRDLLRVAPGERIVLNGASGGVGVHAIQIAKILGAHVVAVSSERNLAFVQELGADEVLPYDEAPLVERSGSFDGVFDIFGTAPYERASHLLAPRGRYVSTLPRPRIVLRSMASKVVPQLEARLVLVRSRARDLARLAQWIDEGRLRPLVDRVWPVEEAADAHRYLETKRARGKVVLEVSRA